MWICMTLIFSPQRPLLQKILTNAREGLDIALGSVSDHFELCLAKCRTSSSVSVFHVLYVISIVYKIRFHQ